MKKGEIQSIIVVLLLVSSAVILTSPISDAHTPAWKIPTFAYVLAVPDEIGIAQSTYIYMWLDKMPDGTAVTNDWRMHNYKLTITAPDGSIETKTWATIYDTTSSQGFSYTPTQIGTYRLKFDFPGQDANAYSYNKNSAFINDTYLASSAETTFTVLSEPIIDFPYSYPLPQEYWTRPIYGENPGWYVISSDWLGTGSPQLTIADRYLQDGVGSRTSHIMWSKPLQSGGVVGGDNFEIQGDTYFESSAYISRFRNPIILAGNLYYREPLHFSNASGGPFKCTDLRTGQVIWSKMDILTPSFAYIYATHQPNQHGVMQPVLIATSGTTWVAYDADTGNWLYNMTDVPTGTAALGPQGEIIRYVITNLGSTSNPNYYLSQWNSSKPFYAGGLTPAVSGIKNSSAASNYDFNVSIPWRNTMTRSFTVLDAWTADIMLCREGDLTGMGNRGSAADPGIAYNYFAVNLNPSKGAIGSVIWKNSVAPAPGNISVLAGFADPINRVFTETYKETMQWVGYNMDTGQKLFGPTTPQASLDYYGYFFPGLTGIPAENKFYCSGMAGIVYCYDEKNGNVLWTYGNGGAGNSTDSGFQVPGSYPIFLYAVADGIVYAMTTEHTIQTPIYKGATTFALNATDGSLIWALSNHNGGGISSTALADGFNTFFNGYDNQIYVVGKGPSDLTVSISDDVIPSGNSVLIKGTMTDMAAGTGQEEQAARFPHGVPAVSDASMRTWMEYVYMQKPRPTDTIGVPIVLSVVDSNGNYREIGTTVSSDGFFSFKWKPDIEGQYTVYASFAGSESYWPSHAITAFAVEQASATPTAPPSQILSPADLYFVPAIAALFVFVAIMFVVTILVLRKRV